MKQTMKKILAMGLAVCLAFPWGQMTAHAETGAEISQKTETVWETEDQQRAEEIDTQEKQMEDLSQPEEAERSGSETTEQKADPEVYENLDQDGDAEELSAIPQRTDAVAGSQAAAATYQINFESGCGDRVYDMPDAQQFVSSDQTFYLPEEAPKRKGYTFAGWRFWDGSHYVIYFPGLGITVTRSIVFTASWVKAEPITFSSGSAAVKVDFEIKNAPRFYTFTPDVADAAFHFSSLIVDKKSDPSIRIFNDEMELIASQKNISRNDKNFALTCSDLQKDQTYYIEFGDEGGETSVYGVEIKTGYTIDYQVTEYCKDFTRPRAFVEKKKSGDTLYTLPLEHPFDNEHEFTGWKDRDSGSIYYPGTRYVLTKNLSLTDTWAYSSWRRINEEAVTSLSHLYLYPGMEKVVPVKPGRTGMYHFETNKWPSPEMEDEFRVEVYDANGNLMARSESTEADSRVEIDLELEYEKYYTFVIIKKTHNYTTASYSIRYGIQVCFDDNDGSGHQKTEYCFFDRDLPDYTPQRAGYIFKGWQTEKNGGSMPAGYAQLAKLSFDKVTLYAKWEKAALSNPFVDVKEGAYYYDPVLWAVAEGITGGKDATHFAPDEACTRGQVVTFLWRANGCPEPASKTNPFTDVSASAYYYKAVLWAYEQGITSGTDATHFAPETKVTRAQFVTFLWRSEGKPAVSIENPFVDVPQNTFTQAILWAYNKGITLGRDSTHFTPNETCTRAQVVTFLYRNARG